MANQKHLDLIKQGSDVWNQWMEKHRWIRPNLSEADLSGVDLSDAYLLQADLWGANLSGANLSHAKLRGADFDGAHLSSADLSGADLSGATLSGAFLLETNFRNATLSEADLRFAYLLRANLSRTNLKKAKIGMANLNSADLTSADLTGADLSRATLVGANLTNATLKDCNIYGVSAWDTQLDGAVQQNLTITPESSASNWSEDQPAITVDNLKVAQFIYLLLNNKEIRVVIDTLTTKAVLILGRFTPERKTVLEAVRQALRIENYVPILFDFDQPNSQTVRETVRTLAHLSHFIIADLTDPSSVPLELETIVPTLPIAVQPILATSQKREFSMFSSLSIRYHWMLPVYRYSDLDALIATLREKVLVPAEKKAQELSQELTKK